MKLHIVKFKNGKYGAYKRNFSELFFKTYLTSDPFGGFLVRHKRFGSVYRDQEFDSVEDLKLEARKHCTKGRKDEVVEVWKT